ncbi:hypothetical protein JAAARDRAFT_602029 [Jaapia argillacea MUCL 33604]|uniref:Uncharacterized protein n=1 Tax=Jaapia argillacea MUCL 33604 TaxID=933084 RepID=A0A067QCH7_9AGAM|nr:hypothetical protein JAAARDRAFT_602029 [Jaapia argillacea MUCL 33604]
MKQPTPIPMLRFVGERHVRLVLFRACDPWRFCCAACVEFCFVLLSMAVMWHKRLVACSLPACLHPQIHSSTARTRLNSFARHQVAVTDVLVNSHLKFPISALAPPRPCE